MRLFGLGFTRLCFTVNYYISIQLDCSQIISILHRINPDETESSIDLTSDCVRYWNYTDVSRPFNVTALTPHCRQTNRRSVTEEHQTNILGSFRGLASRHFILKRRMSLDEINIVNYVHMVLEREIERDDRFLEKDDLVMMLDCGDPDPGVRKSIVGYPSYPLYRDVGHMLQIWMDTRSCPVLELPKFDLLDEQSYVMARAAVISSITPLLDGLKSLWNDWTQEERAFRVREILMLLGKRGIMDLLGIRKTVGTKEMFPPSRQSLLTSFKEKHSPKSELWVGARALAKHYHRDEGHSWWGNCTGSEQDKNDHGLRIVTKILDGATWINIHWLPQDIFVIEARQAEGYGARWTADGKSFRGFLEPQMVDGHEVGWRH